MIVTVLAASALSLSCADLPTGPTVTLDREAIGNVLPAITDARVRVAEGITDPLVRQKTIIAIAKIESELRHEDADAARQEISTLTKLLGEYVVQTPADGADVTAIILMLDIANKIVEVKDAAVL